MKPTAALLAQLEPLPYPERMAALSRWARSSADVKRVVAELGAGPRYERFLAVTATVISGGDVIPFRHDPDGSIRAVAVKHLLRSGRLTGDDLITLLADAPAVLRALVYRTLRSARLTTAADDLIDAVLGRYGDHEAARLLPACGPDAVRRLLPVLDHAVTLSVLARRHRRHPARPRRIAARRGHRGAARPALGVRRPRRCWRPAGSGSSTCWTGTRRPARCLARSAPTDAWRRSRPPGSLP